MTREDVIPNEVLKDYIDRFDNRFDMVMDALGLMLHATEDLSCPDTRCRGCRMCGINEARQEVKRMLGEHLEET